VRGYKTVQANVLGKLTTVLYYLAIVFLFMQVEFAVPYLWFVIALSFVASVIYILEFRSLNELRKE
jgi:cardiolipin synthase